MRNRALEIYEFLSRSGWDQAEQTSLQADFSSRRFARLQRADASTQKAILMDADPGSKTGEFVAISNLLRMQQVAAPQIYAAHIENELVLMEDFGDRNIGRLMDGTNNRTPYYWRATELLAHLHTSFDAGKAPQNLPRFDRNYFLDQVGLFLDGYFMLAHERPASEDERLSFTDAWNEALMPIDKLPRTFVMRDFMPDNLMELDTRIGVLDFQDGGIGPLPYDIASLCECVRRDCNLAILSEVAGFYKDRARSPLSWEELIISCRLLSAQRHTRILGIVARRALNTGQRDKLAYAPRIWKYLETLLGMDELKPVAVWMERHMPSAARDLGT